MNCLEFKRLALSEPNSGDASFVEHSRDCPECLRYVGSIRKMDTDLTAALDAKMPSDLVARLQLNLELDKESRKRPVLKRSAIAASVVVAALVGAFLMVQQFSLNTQIGGDYQKLMAGVVQHMNEQPITPVWDAQRANRSANTLLASYDARLALKTMDNLQFSRICPMGEYRGLHASLETGDGQITFAYIKGTSVGEVLDASYSGYITRVKPVRGGNLLILSRSQKSLEQADRELDAAMVWDI